jgi:hypothetical protein
MWLFVGNKKGDLDPIGEKDTPELQDELDPKDTSLRQRLATECIRLSKAAVG